MSQFWNKRRIEQGFKLFVAIKAIDGFFEIIGGILLFFLDPTRITGFVGALTEHELSRDPNDYISTHILLTAHHLTSVGRPFGVTYLIGHGAIKIFLAYALFRHKLWAYPFAIAFLGLFIWYQVYRIGFDHSAGLTILTIFDCILMWFIVREHQSLRRKQPDDESHNHELQPS